MKLIIDGKNVNFTHRLKNGETFKVSRSKKTETISFFKKPSKVIGMASSCSDGRDVLFIDYDNTDLQVIHADYSLLQHRFHLPQGYLFKSSVGSFHVVCLKKSFPNKVFTMLSYTHTDSAYMSMPLRNQFRNYVLRIGSKEGKGKPKFIGLIGINRPYLGEVSKSHLDFLNKLYPKIRHPNYHSVDNGKTIRLQEYES